MKLKTQSLIILAIAAMFICSNSFAQETEKVQTDKEPVKVEPESVTAEAPQKTAEAKSENAAAVVEKKLVEEKAESDAAVKTSVDPVLPEKENQQVENKKFRFSEFIETKINITYADDNLLENSEFSPKMAIGQQTDSSFVDEPRNINQTHLVLHHKGEGYLPGLLTEAALVLKFNLATDPVTGSPEYSFSENGGFVRIGYVIDHKTDNSYLIDLTGFPFDAESFLLGYHYDLTWAGQSSFPQNTDPVPGMRLGFNSPMLYAFAGFKTHLQPKKDKLNTERVPTETVYAGLFGLGVRPIKEHKLVIEANGGIIEKGDNPIMPEIQNNESRDNILSWGVSGRVSYAQGMPISERMDLRLYQNDPRTMLKLARSDQYKPKQLSFMISGEFNYLSQNLEDPDTTYGTKAFNAPAAMVVAKLKYDYFRVHLEGAYRSLEFLVFDSPGIVPFQAFPDSAQTSGEFYGVLAADYYIKQIFLTVGATFGYKKPATYRGSNTVPVMTVVKRRTTSTAYISPFNRAIENLPQGYEAKDIIEAKLNCQFDLSDFMTFMLEVSYTYDKNRSKVETSPNNSETLIKVFEDSNVTNAVGLAAIIQAKF